MKKRLVGIAMLIALIASASAASVAEKETVLHLFSPKAGAYRPQGPEVIDAQGNIYGVASEGGLSGQCCGAIYQLSPQAGGGYSYNIIYTFTGVGADYFPTGTLTMDTAGNLYGTTAGSYNEIYKLSPDGSGGWAETVLYTGSANGFGFSSVLLDVAGNVYATAGFGGAHNKGFVFELSPSGGTWAFKDIYDFDGVHGSGGGFAGLVMDAAGNLYGTTPQGGTSTNCTNGCGVVFRLRPDGDIWVESVPLNFNETNGSSPNATMSMDASGNLYGTTEVGGAKGYGTVFELTPNGSGGWKEHILHAFSDVNDGSLPDTTLIVGDGVIYGTTQSGGNPAVECDVVIYNVDSIGCGTVFKLVLSGGTWKESILHSFTGLKDGAFPGGVIVDANGNLFGEANSGGDTNQDGIAFELTAN